MPTAHRTTSSNIGKFRPPGLDQGLTMVVSSSLLGVGIQQSPPRYLAGLVWGDCSVLGCFWFCCFLIEGSSLGLFDRIGVHGRALTARRTSPHTRNRSGGCGVTHHQFSRNFLSTRRTSFPRLLRGLPRGGHTQISCGLGIRIVQHFSISRFQHTFRCDLWGANRSRRRLGAKSGKERVRAAPPTAMLDL